MKPKSGDTAAGSYDNHVHRHYHGDAPPISEAVIAALKPFVAFARKVANDPNMPEWARKDAAELILPEPSEDFGQKWDQR